MSRRSCIQVRRNHTTKCARICDVALRVAEAKVTELTGHTAENLVELFVQTVAV